jgi:hypothetical protein
MKGPIQPMDQARANRPLSDVTVIDFGQIFQGPYAIFYWPIATDHQQTY